MVYPEYLQANHDVLGFVVRLLREHAEQLILLAADVRYSFVIVHRLTWRRFARELLVLPLQPVELNQRTLLVLAVRLRVKRQ